MLRATFAASPAALALALAGCASPPLVLEQERTYRVEWIGERPLLDGSHLTITFGADDRAYGTGGCNHWFAGYGVEGEILRFSQIGSTRKACSPALMEQEARFFQALQRVRRWGVSPLDQLQLWPDEGKPIRLLPEAG